MKAYDLRGWRQSLGVDMRDLSAELGVNLNALTEIERCRIGIDEQTNQEIRNAIERIRDRNAAAVPGEELAVA